MGREKQAVDVGCALKLTRVGCVQLFENPFIVSHSYLVVKLITYEIMLLLLVFHDSEENIFGVWRVGFCNWKFEHIICGSTMHNIFLLTFNILYQRLIN